MPPRSQRTCDKRMESEWKRCPNVVRHHQRAGSLLEALVPRDDKEGRDNMSGRIANSILLYKKEQRAEKQKHHQRQHTQSAHFGQ